MGNELRYVCLVETRRLLLLMGVIFGLILFVQYFELPYGNVLSSVFETSTSRVISIENPPSTDSSSDPVASRNLTQSSRDSTGLSVANGVPTAMNASDRMDGSSGNVTDELVVEGGKTLNDTLGDGFGLENDTLDDDDIDPEDEIPLKDSLEMDRDSAIATAVRNYIGETDDGLKESEETSNTSASANHDGIRDVVLTSEKKEGTPSVAEPPSSLLSPQNPESSRSSPVETSPPNATTGKDSEVILQKTESPNIPKADHSAPISDPPIISSTPATRGRLSEPEPAVVPISKMNDLLVQSQLSYQPPKVLWSSPVDQELRNAKLLIENAPLIQNDPQFDVSLFRNFSAFKRSYELMEQTLKVYVYAEGERPIFHQPPLKGIYASEGWFMKLLKANKKFVTKKPKKAHLFYLPFSTRMLEVTLYVPDSHDRKPLIDVLSNYVQTIKTKYSFWNRTSGSDHFLVACHDWAPAETRKIMDNCIRALCNADIKEGFRFGKDASLPETYVQTPQKPLRQLGGKPPSQRRTLAFFAGNMHGYLRPILLSHWQGKDPDMKIFGQLRKGKGQTSYAQYMKSSKYCICARGYEVNSPRVVEAIFYECVPVIISNNFVPPFFETLNWESFAVFVLERDVPNLKNILQAIPKKRYVEMQQRVKKVQQHFLWHPKPVKYDVFHMVLHSIWYNRVFQTRS